jgi:hypothetical protein
MNMLVYFVCFDLFQATSATVAAAWGVLGWNSPIHARIHARNNAIFVYNLEGFFYLFFAD